MAFKGTVTMGTTTPRLARPPKTPEELEADKQDLYAEDNRLQSAADKRNDKPGGGTYVRNYNQQQTSGISDAGSTPTANSDPYRAGLFQNAAPAESPERKLDAEGIMKQWEDIFGEDNRNALAGAQNSLNSQIAANSSRQQEMSAMSGRSAFGGGYAGGAAQAALSAGASQGQLQSNFYQRQQAQKQSFLQDQIENALSSGQFDKAQQLQLILTQLGLFSETGELNSQTDLLDNT